MRGRRLPPRKAPGKPPKLHQHARRLLDANLEERTTVTLSKRREFLGRVCGGGQQVDGLSAAPSDGVDPKRAMGANERDEWFRAAWRALVAKRSTLAAPGVRGRVRRPCLARTSVCPGTHGERARLKRCRATVKNDDGAGEHGGRGMSPWLVVGGTIKGPSRPTSSRSWRRHFASGRWW